MARLAKVRTPFANQWDMAPKYSIPALQKLRGKLETVLYHLAFEGQPLNDERLAAICSGFLPLVPVTTCDAYRSVDDPIWRDREYMLTDMLKHWYMQRLTEDVQKKLVAFMASALDFLAVGTAMPKWDLPRLPVWTAFETVDLERVPAKAPTFIACYEALTGPLAGNVIQKRMTQAGLYAFMRLIGFRSYEVKYPPEHACGMLFIAQARKSGSRTELADPFVSSSMQRLNKVLHTKRLGNCIGGYRRFDERCHPPCPFGRDVCSLGFHAETYRTRERCAHQADEHVGRITPRGEGLCLACIYKGRLSDRKT